MGVCLKKHCKSGLGEHLKVKSGKERNKHTSLFDVDFKNLKELVPLLFSRDVPGKFQGHLCHICHREFVFMCLFFPNLVSFFSNHREVVAHNTFVDKGAFRESQGCA